MHCAVVLAAGRSRRMGTQKLLLPVGGKPTIARVVDALLACRLGRVYVVVGPQSGDIAAALANRDVELVVNPDAESEMLDSLRCGLAALPAECRGVIVALGDQPRLHADVVRQLLDADAQAATGPARRILVPVFEGQRGHPMLISSAYREEIATRFDDVGLRGLLAAHPDEVLEIAVSTPTVLEDMDEPVDYDRIKAAEDTE